MRSTEQTVRWPGARMAPSSKSCARSPTQERNRGAKARRSGAKPEGSRRCLWISIFSVAGLLFFNFVYPFSKGESRAERAIQFVCRPGQCRDDAGQPTTVVLLGDGLCPSK